MDSELIERYRFKSHELFPTNVPMHETITPKITMSCFVIHCLNFDWLWNSIWVFAVARVYLIYPPPPIPNSYYP